MKDFVKNVLTGGCQPFGSALCVYSLITCLANPLSQKLGPSLLVSLRKIADLKVRRRTFNDFMVFQFALQTVTDTGPQLTSFGAKNVTDSGPDRPPLVRKMSLIQGPNRPPLVQ